MRVLIFSLLAFASINGIAQSVGTINTYHYDLKIINPSLVGFEENPSFNIIYRDQWSNISGSPKSMLLSYEQGINSLGGNVGIIFSSIKAGIHSQNKGSLIFSKEINLSEDSYLNIGSNLIFQSDNVSFDDLDVLDPNDELIAQSSTNNGFNMDVGVSYTKDQFVIGVAIQNMLRNSDDEFSPSRNIQFYNLYAHYHWDYSTSIALKPYAFYQIVDTDNSWRFDGGLDVAFFDLITVGGRLRVFDEDQFYYLLASLSAKDWFNVYMILYDQSIQEFNSGNTDFGNNFEMGMRVFIPD